MDLCFACFLIAFDCFMKTLECSNTRPRILKHQCLKIFTKPLFIGFLFMIESRLSIDYLHFTTDWFARIWTLLRLYLFNDYFYLIILVISRLCIFLSIDSPSSIDYSSRLKSFFVRFSSWIHYSCWKYFSLELTVAIDWYCS